MPVTQPAQTTKVALNQLPLEQLKTSLLDDFMPERIPVRNIVRGHGQSALATATAPVGEFVVIDEIRIRASAVRPVLVGVQVYEVEPLMEVGPALLDLSIGDALEPVTGANGDGLAAFYYPGTSLALVHTFPKSPTVGDTWVRLWARAGEPYPSARTLNGIRWWAYEL